MDLNPAAATDICHSGVIPVVGQKCVIFKGYTAIQCTTLQSMISFVSAHILIFCQKKQSAKKHTWVLLGACYPLCLAQLVWICKIIIQTLLDTSQNLFYMLFHT